MGEEEKKFIPPVELKTGYWSPYSKPIEIKFRATEFTSVGTYGTPEFFDHAIHKYVKDFLHLTPTGEVYMLRESREESIAKERSEMRSTRMQKVALVGRNGKVTMAPPPESAEPYFIIPPDTLSFTPLAPINTTRLASPPVR